MKKKLKLGKLSYLQTLEQPIQSSVKPRLGQHKFFESTQDSNSTIIESKITNHEFNPSSSPNNKRRLRFRRANYSMTQEKSIENTPSPNNDPRSNNRFFQKFQGINTNKTIQPSNLKNASPLKVELCSTPNNFDRNFFNDDNNKTESIPGSSSNLKRGHASITNSYKASIPNRIEVNSL